MFGFLRFWLAGIWPLAATYTTAILAIAGCIAFASFSPVFKKTALWIGAAIAIGLVCYTQGVRHEHDRMEARIVASEKRAADLGEELRKAAERDVGRLPAGRVPDDRYDRDNH